MYVQIACKTMPDMVKAVTMMYEGLKADIQFVEVDYVLKAVEGPYHAEAFESLHEVLDRVHEKVNVDTDNLGVYFNSGTKLIVRVFEGAKIPNNPDYMWGQL